jgi:hypothetical protein
MPSPRPKSRKPASPPAASKPEQKKGWLQRFKGLHVRLVRKGLSFHVVLEGDRDRLDAKVQARKVAAAAALRQAEPLRQALSRVLDLHPSTRSVLLHLVVLEKALRKQGLPGIESLPADVLRKALAQFETLVTDWSSVDLATLRGKVAAALSIHDRAVEKADKGAVLSRFEDDHRMQVQEASVTTFMEANEEWERSFTGGALAPPPAR